MSNKLKILLLVLLSGCSLMNSKESSPIIRRFDATAGKPFVGRQEVVEVDKDLFLKSLRDQNLAKIRMVPLTNGQGAADLPEYRLFEVNYKGPYAMLGLESGDVVLSAEEYLIYETQVFPNYLALMAQRGNGTVEVRRGGESIQFKYLVR